MKKINGLFFGLVFGAVNCLLCAEGLSSEEILAIESELAQEVSQELVSQFATTDVEEIGLSETIFSDAEKWQYLEKNFDSNVSSLKFYQKIGKLLNAHSYMLSVPVAVGGAIFAIAIITSIEEATKNAMSPVGRIVNDVADSDYFIYPSTIFVFPGIAYLVSNKILQFVAKKLENKDGRCNQLLTNFVKNWDENKNHTPDCLVSLFENLNKDLLANGKFTKIDNVSAQKIVESIIATSLVINSVK